MKASTKIIENALQPKLTVIKNATKMGNKNIEIKRLHINTLEPNFSYLNNNGKLITDCKSALL